MMYACLYEKKIFACTWRLPVIVAAVRYNVEFTLLPFCFPAVKPFRHACSGLFAANVHSRDHFTPIQG